MRVAVVVERFEAPAGASGGVERVAWELVRELALRGADVTVVCHQARHAAPARVSVEALRVPTAYQPLRLHRFSALARRATSRRFDVVHSLARTRWQDVFRAGGGCHATYLERLYRWPRLQRALSPRHHTILRLEEAVFRDPEQLIQCNSAFVAADLARRYLVPETRVATIYNGVDLERHHPERHASEGRALRQELGVDGPAALFAGTGFARKGLDRALHALKAAPRSARLLVAGADDPRPWRALARRIGVLDRVLFLGQRSDLPALHHAVDLFVLPTRYDPFSNACLEAMASGLPVATTRSNGIAELIVSGVNGFLCGEDFEKAFAALGDRDTLAALGRSARGTAEGFSWKRHVDEVVALYARLER